MNKTELLESFRKKGYSQKIISAFDKVKREDFVSQHLIGYAYEDMPLPVTEGSTLSQPSTVAFMLDLLELGDNQKILEIGSGTGYALALLSETNPNGKIYGVERIKTLAIESTKHLSDRKNVQVIIRNGFNGLPEFKPFDRILVSASCLEAPYHLMEQLSEGGIIVAAVKQSILKIKKQNGKPKEEEFLGFVFVPLVKDEIESK